ncbi:hypothetical protein D3C80_1263540 [compost metagenome]
MAQSGFHCSFTWPPVTGTSVRPPAGSSKTMVPRSMLRSSVGTCSTWPVIGLIGRKGE